MLSSLNISPKTRGQWLTKTYSQTMTTIHESNSGITSNGNIFPNSSEFRLRQNAFVHILTKVALSRVNNNGEMILTSLFAVNISRYPLLTYLSAFLHQKVS